jgi:predicted nucleic acid-binding protein
MSYLVDTGVLLRAFDRDSEEQEVILRALRVILNRGEQLFVTIQNLAEFWNVSTRPKDKRGGLALPIEIVARRVRAIERFATVLSESSSSISEWKRLVINHRVLGVKVHDARLVSVMIATGIPSLLTLNVADFKRYTEITAVTPEAVIAEVEG